MIKEMEFRFGLFCCMVTASRFNGGSFNYCTDRCTLTANHSEITRGYINYCLCFEKAAQRNQRLSLRIQNGEHASSHFAAQSARSVSLYPTWGSCAAIGRRSDTPLEKPIGQSATLSRQSGPRVGAQSVCGSASGGGTGSAPATALYFPAKGGKRTLVVLRKILLGLCGDWRTTAGSNFAFPRSCLRSATDPSRGVSSVGADGAALCRGGSGR